MLYTNWTTENMCTRTMVTIGLTWETSFKDREMFIQDTDYTLQGIIISFLMHFDLGLSVIQCFLECKREESSSDDDECTRMTMITILKIPVLLWGAKCTKIILNICIWIIWKFYKELLLLHNRYISFQFIVRNNIPISNLFS